ncbi:MAG: T9SS type A sorting domain-containing protein [Bacteroidales bacterium]|nr:T9SS type A sorting domain-containing protein [Bacteroidales bacterium]
MDHAVEDKCRRGLWDNRECHAGIKLYPNPASGPVTLQLPSCGPFTLTLRDISGRILSTHEATGGTHLWDASGLQAGMYIMEISNPDGLSTRIKLLIRR